MYSVACSVFLCSFSNPLEPLCIVAFLFVPSYLVAGPCSVPCGGGTQTRNITCVKFRIPNLPQPDTFCEGQGGETKPEGTRECNTGGCQEHMWMRGECTECSKVCGGGQRSCAFKCVNRDGNEVEAALCDPSARPAEWVGCNTQECPAGCLHVGTYGACSQPCGGGEKTRTVQCRDCETHALLEDNRCAGARPRASSPCSLESCGKWNITSWGECSVPCGDGVETASYACFNFRGEEVPPEYCASSSLPSVTRACSLGACPRWEPADPSEGWGDCSEPCVPYPNFQDKRG